MSSEADGSATARWPLALAVVLTMVGGLTTGVADAFDVPLVVGVSGLALFLGGVVVAFALAYRGARASHVSLLRAFGQAFKLGIRWFFFFLP